MHVIQEKSGPVSKSDRDSLSMPTPDIAAARARLEELRAASYETSKVLIASNNEESEVINELRDAYSIGARVPPIDRLTQCFVPEND